MKRRPRHRERSKLGHVAGIAITLSSAASCRSKGAPVEVSPVADASASTVSDAPVVKVPPLVIENRAPGRFVLRANESIKLATEAALEHQSDDGQWTAHAVADEHRAFRLVTSCDEKDVPPCRTLGAGAVLVPESWSGFTCSAQCNAQGCDKDVVAPGTHRLVVTECDDPKRRYESPPFEIPADRDKLLRQLASSSVVSATVCRLDPSAPQDAADPRASDRRAGFKVVAGSENALEVDGRSELVKWLRGKGSFDDAHRGAKKGCARKHMVGFLLKSTDESGQETSAELALDFACNTFTMVRDRDGRREISSSSFDPSHVVVLGIASRGLPKDAELNRLQ